MDSSNRKIETLLKAINTISITFAIILSFNITWAFRIHPVVIVLSITIVFTIYTLIDFNKKNIVTYIMLFLVAMIGILFFQFNKESVVTYSKNLRSWFHQYLIIKENNQIAYSLLILIICIIFVTLCFYLINKNRILRYISSLCFIIVLVYSAVFEININKITIGILLIYIMQVVVEISNHIHNKEKKEKDSIARFYILPLCIIIGVLAVSLPSNSKPIQWTIVKQFVHTVTDQFEDLVFRFQVLSGKLEEEFGVSFIGYTNESGELGGAIKQSNETLLKIKTKTKPYESTYLIGRISDEYTTNGWKNSNIQYDLEDEQKVDIYEILYGMYVNNLIPKENERLFHTMELSITYEDIKTKTLFYPLKMSTLTIQDKKISYNRDTETLKTNKLLKRNFTYDVNYFEINYQSETVKNFLRKISHIHHIESTKLDFDKNNCINYLKQRLKINYIDERLLNKDFTLLSKNRSNVINQYYTQIPEHLPERVRKLAQEITKDYDNNYDKLMAIRSYLKTYRYTLSPTKTKKGEDFVDYFLFEQKEGYCTYFATSMAILARCIGIPTRYVEGLLVDYSNKKGQFYEVSSSSMHAWVEAYIKGCGWIPFEPTPGYGTGYSMWEEKNRNNYNNTNAKAPEISMQKAEEQEIQESTLSKESTRTKYMGRFFIIMIGILCILFVCIMIGLYYNRRLKYQNASNEDKIKYLMGNIIHYLAMEELKISANQTLLDYVHSLHEPYRFVGYSLEDICFIYMGYRYSNKKIRDDDINTIMLYHNELRKYIEKKMNLTRLLRFKCSLLDRFSG